MLLKDRIAVIHGAGGAVGGAVARSFAREGAKVFLGGRNVGPVDAVATEIVAAGGTAKAAKVDPARLADPAVQLGQIAREA